MDTASRVLVVGGVLNLAFGLMVGAVLAGLRARNPNAEHRYLLTAHQAGLQQGLMLLGLIWAVALSPLAAEVELLAAGLLAASSACLDLAAVVNWALGVQDEFKARSPGLIAGSVSALLSVPGLAILIWGVFQGL